MIIFFLFQALIATSYAARYREGADRCFGERWQRRIPAGNLEPSYVTGIYAAHCIEFVSRVHVVRIG
jgi:hypothetical protein